MNEVMELRCQVLDLVHRAVNERGTFTRKFTAPVNAELRVWLSDRWCVVQEVWSDTKVARTYAFNATEVLRFETEVE